MKEIKAVVRPARLYSALMALRDIPGMPGFIVTDTRAFPRGHPLAGSHSHGIDALDSFEMVKIECVVPDRLATAAVEAIEKATSTGDPGDGKIIVCDIEDIVRIATGQHGEEAI
jgi:nitrogen regulatory protein PII